MFFGQCLEQSHLVVQTRATAVTTCMAMTLRAPITITLTVYDTDRYKLSVI